MKTLRLAIGVILICLVTAVPIEASEPYLDARPNYNWTFPNDHRSHPSYKTEWWYFTGIVESESRRYGYQFTIFRSATDQLPTGGDSWSTNQVLMGHLAFSDLTNKRHRAFFRVSREHPKGSKADTGVPGLIRVRDWTLKLKQDKWTIEAQDGNNRLRLTLEPTRSPLFQGPGGYSQKGPDTGQASQYYSFTRMNTSGTVAMGGQSSAVGGQSWFDHEFGSSQMNDSLVGWDWISLRLSNGGDLMIYRLRKENGGVSTHSSATYRSPDDEVQYIESDQWTMKPTSWWQSSVTGGNYPVSWTVTVEDPNMELTVDRSFDKQEMVLKGALNDPYWEGVISTEGTVDDRSVTGNGFLEMTGYVGGMDESF